MHFIFAIILPLTFGVEVPKVRYDGFQVFRIVPENDEQLKILRDMQLDNENYTFWNDVTHVNQTVDVMVPPNLSKNLETQLSLSNLTASVIIHNVQNGINHILFGDSNKKHFDWKRYHDLHEIYRWLHSLVKKYPGIVTLIHGGTTYEGRNITGVGISYKRKNKAVFIEGGAHGCQRISPATATYIINELLSSQDPNVRRIAESRDWYIFPVTNPDGYEYTKKDPLWCKNRNPITDKCIGVDLNRNWQYKWMHGGSSSDPCHWHYAGSRPFLEIETWSLSEFINTIADSLEGYISLQSYSQKLAIPFGHNENEVPRNNDELLRIGNIAVTALAERYGTIYEVGNMPQILGFVSGNSVDWVLGYHRNIKLAYTYKLRDQGKYGYLLPPNQIIPTGEETLDSLIIMLSLATAQVHFDHYQVYQVVPKTQEQLDALREMQNTRDSYNFWTDVTILGKPVDIMVAPHLKAEMQEIALRLNLIPTLKVDNVQTLIDAESKANRKTSSTFDWTNYQTLDEIYDWLRSLERQYPAIVKVVKGGNSYEGREILGVKISFKSGNKGVFLEGGIHGREWIAPATVTYIANELLVSTDPVVRKVAESRDWYIFPVVNPDGYVYTHTTFRMWSKTRKPYGTCYGSDPNRNWGYKWNHGGASNNPCADNYAGPTAFSEIETGSLSEFINTIADSLEGYISFQSYSQKLAIPFGHNETEVPRNNDELLRIGNIAVTALAERYGTIYEVGNIPLILGFVSGNSVDWVLGYHRNITFAYTYKLRDTGRHGFILPPDQIIPTGEETLDSLISIIHEFGKYETK